MGILKFLRKLFGMVFPIVVAKLDEFSVVYREAKCKAPVTIEIARDTLTPPANTIEAIHRFPGPATVRYGVRVTSTTPDDRSIMYSHFHAKSSPEDICNLVEEAHYIAFMLRQELPRTSIVMMDLEGNVIPNRSV